jgi:hypothetical protein
MTDRAKVIRAVETCFDSWIDKHRDMGLDVHGVELLKREALELLKEQEAVKPIVDHYALPLTYTTVQFIEKYYCGICNEKITRNNVYCHKCGRKVKWDERTH